MKQVNYALSCWSLYPTIPSSYGIPNIYHSCIKSDENIVIVECEEKVQKDKLFGEITKLLERLQVDWWF